MRQILKEQNDIFLPLFKIVVAVVAAYILLFVYLEAFLAASLLAVGLVVSTPTILYLYKKNQSVRAKSVFYVSAQFYIVSASVGTSHLVRAETYCLSAMVLALLLFEFRKVSLIAAAMALSLLSWVMIRAELFSVQADALVPKNLPIAFLRDLNFIGSFLIMFIFLSLFIRNVNQIQHKLVLLQKLSSAMLSQKNELSLIKELIQIICRESEGKWGAYWAVDNDGLGLRMTQFWAQNSVKTKGLEKISQISHFKIGEGLPGRVLQAGSALYFKSLQANAAFLRQVQATSSGINSAYAFPVKFDNKTIGVIEIFSEKFDKAHLELLSVLRDGGFHIGMSLHETRLEKLLQATQRLAKIGTWSYDLISGRINWSEQMFDLFPGNERGTEPSFEQYRSKIHPDDLEVWDHVVSEGVKTGAPYKLQFRILHFSKVIWIEAIGAGVFDDSGRVQSLSGTCQDITEAKSLQLQIETQREKLVSSSKMSALGEMAGGIAHEINNPLAIIHGKAGLLKEYLKQGSVIATDFERHLTGIENTTDRIAKIIRGLRVFARSADDDPFELADVRQIVDDTLELCREKFARKSIELRVDCPDALQIECRAAQISQVLMNLLSNAFDAVEVQDVRWVELKIDKFGKSVCMSVIDSGAKIQPQIAEKLMQPFFTTKEVGKGTGLGLSISKGICEGHGGFLRFDSLFGNTRFVVELPMNQNHINESVRQVV